MVRSFTERLIGGVCGGLSHRTPLSATLWRLIWIVLALIAPPAALAAYLLWWWLIPLESPFRKHSDPVGTLIAVVLTVIVFAGWFARDLLISPTTGQDATLPLFGLILAGAFLYRQLQSRAWPNVLIALVLLCVPILMLLGATGALPGGLFDLIGRALPGVLIFLGLTLLLRGRVPYASPIALLVTVVAIVSLATTAITTRSNRPLDTPPVTISQAIDADVTLLQLNLESLTTDMTITPGDAGSRTITITFIGSTENVLTDDYINDGTGLATYTIRETRPNSYPRLENLGRGSMTVEIPVDMGIALAFDGEDGNAVFDLQGISLERLNLTLDRGGVGLTLPAYQPRSPGVLDTPGELRVLDGNLRIVVPSTVGGRFEIPENSTPIYDESQYRIEVARPSWLLLSRNYETAEMKANYRLTVPNGETQLDVQG